MAEATITIYPPITNSWMPAFKQTDSVRVYFSISDYNNYNDIKYLQFICVSQNTNTSILSRNAYPAGVIMIDKSNIHIDDSRAGDDKYYFEISPEYLEDPEKINGNNAFQRDINFKVQIRFASTEAEDFWNNPDYHNGDTKYIGAWNNNNLDKLSEWSRVCIIRAIAQPVIKLYVPYCPSLGVQELKQLNPAIINDISYSFIAVQGQMDFGQIVNEQEQLESYRVQISNNNTVIYDSLDLFTDSENSNQIYHSIGLKFEDDTDYILIFSYVTENGYAETINYSLDVNLNEYATLLAKIHVLEDEENACMAIHLISILQNGHLYVDYNETLEDAYAIYNNQLQQLNVTAGGGIQDYITILRASDADNFTIWEDIHTEYLNSYENLNYIYKDYTAEAGVLYKYAVQKRGTDGSRSNTIFEMQLDPTDPSQEIEADPHIFTPQYLYLVTKNDNVIFKFNAEVTSYKYVVSENVNETIGSKYPFVLRNGNVNYRQFNISGMISSLIDREEGVGWDETQQLFTESVYTQKKKSFYGDNYSYYENYLKNKRYSDETDIVYERKYREKIIAFLNDGKPKLFKTTPEGNILIRLTNISLTPEKQIGRMIYSFQATATEIADCTVANYEKFNIIEPINYFGGYV